MFRMRIQKIVVATLMLAGCASSNSDGDSVTADDTGGSGGVDSVGGTSPGGAAPVGGSGGDQETSGGSGGTLAQLPPCDYQAPLGTDFVWTLEHPVPSNASNEETIELSFVDCEGAVVSHGVDPWFRTNLNLGIPEDFRACLETSTTVLSTVGSDAIEFDLPGCGVGLDDATVRMVVSVSDGVVAWKLARTIPQ